MTTLDLYTGVPWSIDSNDIKYEDSLADKLDYLLQYKIMSIANCNIGNYETLVVPKRYDEVCDINYCHFSSGGKTFFCFVTSVRYNSDTTTTLEVTPDWLFMYINMSGIVKNDFIERMTPSDDTIYNRLNEGFNPSLHTDAVYYPFKSITVNGDVASPHMTILVFMNVDENGQLLTNVDGGWTTAENTDPNTLPNSPIRQVYSYQAYAVDSIQTFSRWLNYVDNPDDSEQTVTYMADHIISIHYVPSTILTAYGSANATSGLKKVKMRQKQGVIDLSSWWQSVDKFRGTNGSTYTNVMHKLDYSSEFRCLQISNNMDTNVDFDITKFPVDSSGNPVVKFLWTFNPSPDTVLWIIPLNYNGVTNDYEHSVEINSFPQAAWNSDIYKLWYSQNKYQINNQYASLDDTYNYNTVKNAAALSAGLLTLNSNAVVGSVTSSMDNVFNTKQALNKLQAEIKDRKHSNNVVQKGTHNSVTKFLYYPAASNIPGYASATGYYLLEFRAKSCNFNNAKSADLFLQRYGYTQKNIITFNIPSGNGHRFYKYISSKVVATIPYTAKRYIERKLDDGVTFWYGNKNVGDY